MKTLTILMSCALALAPRAAGAEQQTAPGSAKSPDDQIVHVLNRLTMGARPGDIDKVRSLGVQKFIEAQLHPETIAESPLVTAQVQRTPQLRQSSAELMTYWITQIKANQARKVAEEGGTKPADAPKPPQVDVAMALIPAGPVIQNYGPGARKTSPGGIFNGDFQTAVLTTRLVRAIESPRQLQELMTDFWFNHFNISMAKGADRVLVGPYEEQAIRPNVMGNFRTLLGATMHHPAMMFYLDNAQNTKADYVARNPKDLRKGINENYARELLELHTLGVDGGYTQKDVQELARVLTGWGMPAQRLQLQTDGGYWASFDPRRHDFGTKVVLGQTIEGTGAQEIETVLDMLSRHPSTAKHVSYQLAQYFVADNPPASLVAKLATKFSQTRGDIKAVLTTLFASPEFWDPQYSNSKFKSPFRYTVSACRATGLHIQNPASARRLQQFLVSQGQPLYQCQTPDGYKNTKETWLNPDGLMKRMDFAGKLALAQRMTTPLDYRWVLSTVNGGRLSAKTQTAVANVPENQRVGALIGSPEFMQY